MLVYMCGINGSVTKAATFEKHLKHIFYFLFQVTFYVGPF